MRPFLGSTLSELLGFEMDLRSSRGQIIINGSLECSRCSAGAGGALFSRADILLTKLPGKRQEHAQNSERILERILMRHGGDSRHATQ